MTDSVSVADTTIGNHAIGAGQSYFLAYSTSSDTTLSGIQAATYLFARAFTSSSSAIIKRIGQLRRQTTSDSTVSFLNPNILKSLLIQVTSSFNISSAISTSLSVLVQPVLQLTKGIDTLFRALSLSTPDVVRTAGLNASTVSLSGFSQSKETDLNLQAVSTPIIQTQSALSKYLSLTSTTLISIIYGKLLPLLSTISSTSTAFLSKQVQNTLTTVSPSILQISNLITKTAQVTSQAFLTFLSSSHAAQSAWYILARRRGKK